MNPEKKFEDWSFDDLATWSAWEVIRTITEGKMDLKTRMHVINQTVIRWREEQVKKEAKKGGKGK